LIGGGRKIRDHVAPPIVRHDHLGEPSAELGRLRDHPHASLRPVLAPDDTADIVGIDLCGGWSWLGVGPSHDPREQQHRETGGKDGRTPQMFHHHARSSSWASMPRANDLEPDLRPDKITLETERAESQRGPEGGWNLS